VSQRRAEVWKVRAADGPLLSRPLAPIESNRELIVPVELSKLVELRGDAEAAKSTMRSWSWVIPSWLAEAIVPKRGTYLPRMTHRPHTDPNPCHCLLLLFPINTVRPTLPFLQVTQYT
jgi:hypothetical protein